MLALLPTGRPEALVEIAELAPPEPAPDEALVAVEAFSLNRGETFLLERPRRGWRPGKDVAGRVLVAAADGSGPTAGTPVVGHPPHSGWAQLAAVATDALAPLPETIGAAEAATLPLWFGQASRTPARLDFFDHFSQSGATIRHFHYLDGPDPPADDLATLVRLVERGALHPELRLLADRSQTAQALSDLRDRRIRGNAVLTIKETLT